MATQSRRRNTTRHHPQQQRQPQTSTSELMQQQQHQFRRVHHSKRYRQDEERKLKCMLFSFAITVMSLTGYILYTVVWLRGGLADALPFSSSSSSAGNSQSKYLYASMDPEEAYPIQELLHPDYVANVSSPLPLDTQENVYHPSFLYPSSRKEHDNDQNLLASSSSSSLANRHRIVEFYAPWCPHCQRFKKKYIQFARNLQKAVQDVGEDIIDVYAVSCVPHRPLCQNLNIHSYPTIRLYKAGSYDSTDLKQTKLHPLRVFKELGMEYTTKKKKQPSSSTEHHNDDDIMMITGHGIDEHGSAQSTSNKKSHLRTHSSSTTTATTATTITKTQIYNDATVSFDFAMKNSIFTKSESLNHNETKVFHKWLDLLDKSLPPPMASLQKTVQTLVQHKHEIVESEHTLISYLHNKTQVKDEDSSYSWSTVCSPPAKDGAAGGYTCGLWQLFHILSMGVVEWNVLVTDDYQTISTMEVADLMRNYIDHFFGCEECRTNFLNEYDSCAFRRCERLSHNHTKSRNESRQLPLWLWETHNAINLRLYHERVEREQEEEEAHGGSNMTTMTRVTLEDKEDALWPHRQDCPTCWNEDGTFQEDAVYKYLRVYYWPTDEISRTYKQELFPVRSKYYQRSSSILFGSSTMRMTFLPLGTLLVFGTWWYLKKRRRTHHPKSNSGAMRFS